MMKRKTRTARKYKTSALVCAVATLTAVGVSACSGSTQGGASGGAAAGSAATLTIQGDAGNPALVENFNPLQPSSALHGVNLIYESMEIVSPIDGTFTPFLATGNKFTDPKTLVFTIRQGAKWSDGKPFTPSDVVFTFNLLKKFPWAGRQRRLAAPVRHLDHGKRCHVHVQRPERAFRLDDRPDPDRA